jgi:hypothetical protein
MDVDYLHRMANELHVENLGVINKKCLPTPGKLWHTYGIFGLSRVKTWNSPTYR